MSKSWHFEQNANLDCCWQIQSKDTLVHHIQSKQLNRILAPFHNTLLFHTHASHNTLIPSSKQSGKRKHISPIRISFLGLSLTWTLSTRPGHGTRIITSGMATMWHVIFLQVWFLEGVEAMLSCPAPHRSWVSPPWPKPKRWCGAGRWEALPGRGDGTRGKVRPPGWKHQTWRRDEVDGIIMWGKGRTGWGYDNGGGVIWVWFRLLLSLTVWHTFHYHNLLPPRLFDWLTSGLWSALSVFLFAAFNVPSPEPVGLEDTLNNRGRPANIIMIIIMTMVLLMVMIVTTATKVPVVVVCCWW